MQSQINSKNQSDTVNIFLKRGDTWQVNTISSTLSHITFPANGPIVHVNAYGLGNSRPVIDGMVADWNNVPYDGTGGIRRWNTIFRVEFNDCSVKNLEIRNYYGNAIHLQAVESFTMAGNYIHGFGSCAIAEQARGITSGCTIAHNIVHTGQLLRKYNKRDAGWDGALNIKTDNGTKPHHIHHNIVYDICGEGILTSNSLVEWNLVGDTGSVGISNVPHDFDSYNAVIRYNLILNSSDFSNYGISGQEATAIRLMDELPAGSNEFGTFEYYGNVIINRHFGLHQHINKAQGCYDPFKWAKVYNNLFIDSVNCNLGVFDPDNYLDYVNVYNNSSLLIKRTNGFHAKDGGKLPHSDWTITGNHFWTKGQSTPTVPSAWKGNWNIKDPQLLGQDTVNWTSLTGPNYWRAINPIKHLNPPSSSPIHNLNPVLTLDIDKFIKEIEDYHLKGSSQTVLPGDFNGDNKVNTLDYEIMKTEFFKVLPSYKADMNGKDGVNDLDYELFRREFGKKK